MGAQWLSAHKHMHRFSQKVDIEQSETALRFAA
jgi:hypothetical protein